MSISISDITLLAPPFALEVTPPAVTHPSFADGAYLPKPQKKRTKLPPKEEKVFPGKELIGVQIPAPILHLLLSFPAPEVRGGAIFEAPKARGGSRVHAPTVNLSTSLPFPSVRGGMMLPVPVALAGIRPLRVKLFQALARKEEEALLRLWDRQIHEDIFGD